MSTHRRQSLISVCAACLTLGALGCGQQQRLVTHESVPKLARILSIEEGFELLFDGPPERIIKVWIQGDSTQFVYKTTTGNPLLVPLNVSDLRVRYAYLQPRAKRLGQLSAWHHVRRQFPTPYPKVSCKMTSKGHDISIPRAPKAYGGWSISEDGINARRSLPSSQTHLFWRGQRKALWIQWFSASVRGPFQKVSCTPSPRLR